MKEEIEKYHQNEAKQIIDSMFECGIFAAKITRDYMQAYENLLAYMLQSNAESAQRLADFRVKYDLKKK